MAPVTIRGLAVAGGVAAVALLLPPPAAGQGLLAEGETGDDSPNAIGDEPKAAEPARVSVRLRGLQGGKLRVKNRVRVIGHVRPFVAGQRVRTRVVRMGRVIKGRRVPVQRVPGANRGVFRFRSPQLWRPGKYRVRAFKPPTRSQEGGQDRSRIFTIRYPGLNRGDRGKAAALFTSLLRRQGYHAPGGRAFNAGAQRAVLAFRKVNRMPRTMKATPGIFKRLAAGRGAFRLRYPTAGRHVEVDLARQVMVLAAGGEARHTFHISSGRPGARSTRGHFRFYRREPGFNRLGMYYSVYYHRGEAAHGYRSVPTYPASAGCIRNPIPNSRFIYGWVRLGMSIFVY
jgi:hypothetical protein